MLTFILHSLGRILLQISVEGKIWCCLISLTTTLNHEENLTAGICAAAEGQPLRQDFDLAPVVGGHSQIHLVEGHVGPDRGPSFSADARPDAFERHCARPRAVGEAGGGWCGSANFQGCRRSGDGACSVGAGLRKEERAFWRVENGASNSACSVAAPACSPLPAVCDLACFPVGWWAGGRANAKGVPYRPIVAAAWMLLGRWVALPASSWHGRLFVWTSNLWNIFWHVPEHSIEIYGTCQNMFQRFDNDFHSLKPYSHAHFREAEKYDPWYNLNLIFKQLSWEWYILRPHIKVAKQTHFD